jgi:hypothetical protein
MKVGVTLPTFRDDSYAVDAARRAEGLGLEGVFVFDHIWPLGRPDRPALSAFPVLGSVAAATERVFFGPLVGRVGLVPDDVLFGCLRSLDAIAPGRLIAGLGTGDRRSFAENLAYGIPADGPDERRLALRRCAERVVGLGRPVWVGAGATATTELAVGMGPEVAVNVWEAQPAVVAALGQRCEVTWGGRVAGGVPEIAEWLSELASAGASWAVCAWPESIDTLAEAVALVSGG